MRNDVRIAARISAVVEYGVAEQRKAIAHLISLLSAASDLR
jgi:hypothetical protein